MLKKLKNKLIKNLKWLIYLKYNTMTAFANVIGVSNTYLSRIVNDDKTYLHTIMENLLICDASILIKITDDKGNIFFETESKDVKQLVLTVGKYCKKAILDKYISINEFSNKNKKFPIYQCYLSFRANSKASLDHIIKYFEALHYKVEIEYKVDEGKK